jgi:hypothetical protein
MPNINQQSQSTCRNKSFMYASTADAAITSANRSKLFTPHTQRGVEPSPNDPANRCIVSIPARFAAIIASSSINSPRARTTTANKTKHQTTTTNYSFSPRARGKRTCVSHPYPHTKYRTNTHTDNTCILKSHPSRTRTYFARSREEKLNSPANHRNLRSTRFYNSNHTPVCFSL